VAGALLIPIPEITLRPGYEISQIIKGGWQLAGDHGAVASDRAISDMVAFVDAGIKTFDCADIYTGVEELIGRFLAELTGRRGADARQRVKIHTKFVPDRDALSTLQFRDVEAIIDRSLSRLGVDRLDLVQFHWWNYEVPGHVEAVEHLARLHERGKIDRIGVTNFDAEHLHELCKAVDIASAQVQFSLLDQRSGSAFADLARDHNVGLLVYGVLAGGFLSDAWLGKPDPGFEFENRSLVKYRLIIDEFGGWDLFQDLLNALQSIANAHDCDVSTIAIRAILDSPDVAAAIIGARYANRLPETLRVFDIALSDHDRRTLTDVLDRRSGPNGPVFGLERDLTGRHGQIMKYNLNKGGDSQQQDTERRGSSN